MDKIMDEIYTKLAIAEMQHETGQGRPMVDVLEETREKYNLMDLVKENDSPRFNKIPLREK